VAAKVEEIYPPKLTTFAYVTDGACTEADILDMELVVMKTLKWKLTPITPASWINVFLQVLSVSPHQIHSLHFLRSRSILSNSTSLQPNESEDVQLVKPNYCGVDFVRAVRIIDLTVLHIQSFRYSYAALAAAAIYHTKGNNKIEITLV
jgi:G1/S-specific cyclin-E1